RLRRLRPPGDAGSQRLRAGVRRQAGASHHGPDPQRTALAPGGHHLPGAAARQPGDAAVRAGAHGVRLAARAPGGHLRPRGRLVDALVLLGSFFLLMIVGVPVAYALGLAALVGALWMELPLDAVMIQLASGVNKFSLLAIPFFVLAGAIMAEGGMSRRLVAFACVLVGFIRGGLSLVNILASTFFGAISGSSLADTASVGSVLIPEMERKGYPREFSTAVTVSGSVQA